MSLIKMNLLKKGENLEVLRASSKGFVNQINNRKQLKIHQKKSIKQIISISSSLLLLMSFISKNSLAQSSINLPSQHKPEIPTTIEKPLPPTTFGIINPPPSMPSTPSLEDKIFNPLNIYRLDIGDAVSVIVEQFPEFNFSGIIDSEGNVSIPIVGRISIKGLTLEEVETKISYELGLRYLQEEPEVNAILVGARPVEVTVVGEVIRPGFYTLAPGTPISSILLTAGGSTSQADLRAITLRRILVDGTIVEENIDLYTPLIKGIAPPKVTLQGGDSIIISKLEIGQDQDYDRYLISRSTLPQQQISVRVLAPAGTTTVFRNLLLPNGSSFLDVIASLPPEDGLFINLDEVALVRFDPEKGSVITQKLDASAAINGDLAQDVPLQNEDVIIVSRTLIGKIFNALTLITRPIRDIFSFTIFFNNIDNLFN